MSNQKHPAKHKQPPINEEWIAVRDFIQKHTSTALTTLLVILVAGFAVWTLNQRRAQQVLEAEQRLATAQSSSEFEEIVSRFPRSEAAPLAQLSLAKVHFDLGRYQEALEAYEYFKNTWSEHPFTSTATLGRLFALEALGAPEQMEEAEAGFRDFAEKNPDHYLYPQARLGEARLKQHLGYLEEARAIYEDFIANHPDNPWGAEIEERLMDLERKMQRQQSS